MLYQNYFSIRAIGIESASSRLSLDERCCPLQIFATVVPSKAALGTDVVFDAQEGCHFSDFRGFEFGVICAAEPSPIYERYE